MQSKYAFPTQNGSSGMTKRDYFAAQAMVGMLANQSTKIDSNEIIQVLAGVCYNIADAMLKAREQPDS